MSNSGFGWRPAKGLKILSKVENTYLLHWHLKKS